MQAYVQDMVCTQMYQACMILFALIHTAVSEFGGSPADTRWQRDTSSTSIFTELWAGATYHTAVVSIESLSFLIASIRSAVVGGV